MDEAVNEHMSELPALRFVSPISIWKVRAMYGMLMLLLGGGISGFILGDGGTCFFGGKNSP